MPRFLYAADILMIPPTLRPLQSNTVLPMKLFLYLAAGRALFGPEAPDTAGLLRHDDNAWLATPDDLGAATRALETLIETPALRQRLGEAARATAEEFTWAARGQKLVRFVGERLASTARRS